MQSYRNAEALRHPKNERCAIALRQREDEFISSQPETEQAPSLRESSGLQMGQHFSKGGRA
jgi:hypothetical protein